MIFFELFYTFLLIGAFTFGGGYSMLALIQHEVVENHAWLTAQEFTDLVAISQMTPGPVGINAATYAGYSAVIAAGYPPLAAAAGAILASLAVVIIPVALVLLVGKWLLANNGNPAIASVMKTVRLAVIGLILAAALSLAGPQSFGTPGINPTFIISIAIFAAVFFLSLRRKASPILLIVLSGIVGLAAYSIV